MPTETIYIAQFVLIGKQNNNTGSNFTLLYISTEYIAKLDLLNVTLELHSVSFRVLV